MSFNNQKQEVINERLQNEIERECKLKNAIDNVKRKRDILRANARLRISDIQEAKRLEKEFSYE